MSFTRNDQLYREISKSRSLDYLRKNVSKEEARKLLKVVTERIESLMTNLVARDPNDESHYIYDTLAESQYIKECIEVYLRTA